MLDKPDRRGRAKAKEQSASAVVAPPCAMVIFGAAGDLTKRLVVPALYNLANDRQLSGEFRLVGVDLTDMSADQWRANLTDAMKGFVAHDGEFHLDEFDHATWRWLTTRMSYLSGDLNNPETYRRLVEHLTGLDKTAGTAGNRLFYLAVADRFFGPAVTALSTAGLTAEGNGQWRRVIIEKPFGHDLASAKALNAQILKTLQEHQIYRIDHFLGKETVQNIMALRFANGLFEPLWNRQQIEHVQINVSETVGVEHRGKFYERTGALRDMVPNHVFQLLAVTAMEPPISFDADAVRAKKTEVVQAIKPLDPAHVFKDVVRGQYDAGQVLGKRVRAYRQEPDVAPNSTTETYIAWKLNIDNWRWAGVPFYLRTGKRMAQRHTEIAIQFKRLPFELFRNAAFRKLHTNTLVIQIQPVEGISLSFGAKIPGALLRVGSVNMSFEYSKYFGTDAYTGYEVLLYDCMIGDATLFQRADMVEAGWKVVDPVLDVWRALPPRKFPNYASGTWGPAEADQLLELDGRKWRKIEP